MPGRTLSAVNTQGHNDLEMNLHLNHDDVARANFLVAFKKRVNLAMGAEIRANFNERIAPELEKTAGHKLSDTDKADRKIAKAAMESTHLYKAWAVLTYISQGMMWEIVDGVLDHDLDRLQKAFDTYNARPNKLGSLKLNPQLKIPKNISKTEIHRQPGGFCFEKNDTDITAGARYNGGGLMYSSGKGRKSVAGNSGGDFVLSVLKERYPDFKPKRILELGCGTGRNTPSYKQLLPDAEVHAVDIAPSLLRWGHAYAESEGQAVHFHQMDATALDFPDESFDLVVSHILGHETTQRGLPKWVGEAWRVLAPGGVAFHVDVPIQTGYLKLADQVMNDWQVRFNGEPFWMGWADANLKQIMRDHGIPDEAIFAEHIARDAGGAWFCHGARKPKTWSNIKRRAA
ncbi:MAG: methyltransferase domain-containing protein [Rhodospirillaceae bacterium]|nr:methyltransferase domain-containing protein [Rhodospirillaceae bacterium]